MPLDLPLVEFIANSKNLSGVGLFHGTRAAVKTIAAEGLRPGIEVSLVQHRFIRELWPLLSQTLGIDWQSLFPEKNLAELFPTPISQTGAVDLGNSIRIAKNIFNYEGVAFARDLFSARGYADQGSEASMAARALYLFAKGVAPAIVSPFELNEAYQPLIEEFQSGPVRNDTKGVVFRLARIPETGYFYFPNDPHKSITTLRLHPASKAPAFSEIMFRGVIPYGCLEIEPIG